MTGRMIFSFYTRISEHRKFVSDNVVLHCMLKWQQ